MDLTILDRLLLMYAVRLAAPAHSNVITMRPISDLIHDLDFPEEEITEKQITFHKDGSITWNETHTKSVEIGPVAMDIIHSGLISAIPVWDKADEITLEHMDLFRKFGVSIEDIEVA